MEAFRQKYPLIFQNIELILGKNNVEANIETKEFLIKEFKSRLIKIFSNSFLLKQKFHMKKVTPEIINEVICNSPDIFCINPLLGYKDVTKYNNFLYNNKVINAPEVKMVSFKEIMNDRIPTHRNEFLCEHFTIDGRNTKNQKNFRVDNPNYCNFTDQLVQTFPEVKNISGSIQLAETDLDDKSIPENSLQVKLKNVILTELDFNVYDDGDSEIKVDPSVFASLEKDLRNIGDYIDKDRYLVLFAEVLLGVIFSKDVDSDGTFSNHYKNLRMFLDFIGGENPQFVNKIANILVEELFTSSDQNSILKALTAIDECLKIDFIRAEVLPNLPSFLSNLPDEYVEKNISFKNKVVNMCHRCYHRDTSLYIETIGKQTLAEKDMPLYNELAKYIGTDFMITGCTIHEHPR